MKHFRRALSTSLVLAWAMIFSSATVLTAGAQQDDSLPPPQASQQEQAPAYAPPPPSDQSMPQASEPQYSQPQAPETQPPQRSELPDQVNSAPSDQPMEIPGENPPSIDRRSEDRQTEDRSRVDSPSADRSYDDRSYGDRSNEDRSMADRSVEDRSQQNDPPGRAARLQYMSGSVSVQPHGTAEWVQGSVNRPLTIADNVWADKDSRAELNVGTGLIRISSETSLTLTNVNDSSVQLSLHQGTMNLHVRHLYNGEIYEVDTPNQAFTIIKTGDYRFDVDPGADTTSITVWHGEGESTGQGPSVRIKAGEQAKFTGGNSLAHEIQRAPRPDGFDDWCQVRNRREDESISARYVSPDVIGSEDLDAYGTWRQTPEYGPVWVPSSVQPGWAPYSHGHWIYEEPWGWTWVDDAPWGFAPFHYGRWVSFGDDWGWAPGPYYGGWARGWYAPALVAWYGGPNWGLGVGFGGIGFGFGGGFGWCALGFGEPFIPWYHTGWGYFRNVNVYNTRITNINNFHNGFRNGFANAGPLHHVNMNARGGFTAVNRGTLEHGLPVQHNAVRLTSNDLRNAPALNRVSAAPTREARLGPNAGRPAAAAPSRVMSRPVVSRIAPPAGSVRTPSNTAPRGTFRPGNNQVAGSRGLQNKPQFGNAARSPNQTSARSTASPQGHYVPRPPQSFANNSRANGAVSNNANVRANSSGAFNGSRTSSGQMPASRNVPRPPSAGGTANVRNSQPAQTAMNRAPVNMGTNRSVPRPSPGSVQHASQSSSFGRSGYSPAAVPRPSGPVQPAPRSYSSGGSSGGSGYSSRYSVPRYSGQGSGRFSSGGSSAPRYSQSPGYSGSGSPYGGRSYGSSPYQGGRSSAPSYSSRSYGGGSYGGGRSYSSGSRGSSSGGGSRAGSGGGGGGSHGSSHSGGGHH